MINNINSFNKFTSSLFAINVGPKNTELNLYIFGYDSYNIIKTSNVY